MSGVLDDFVIRPLSNFSSEVVSGTLDSIGAAFFWILGAVFVVGSIDLIKRFIT